MADTSDNFLLPTQRLNKRSSNGELDLNKAFDELLTRRSQDHRRNAEPHLLGINLRALAESMAVARISDRLPQKAGRVSWLITV